MHVTFKYRKKQVLLTPKKKKKYIYIYIYILHHSAALLSSYSLRLISFVQLHVK